MVLFGERSRGRSFAARDRRRLWGAALPLVAWLAPAAYADQEVRIGVLAHRAESLKLWSQTAEHLTRRLPGYRFRLVPLDNHSISPAVAGGEVEFVLTNPGSYIELETKYGVTRILTLRNLRQGKPYTQFGSVIFARAARADIRTLADLKGKSFMAVDKNAFGGFLMAWREFRDQGIDPFTDFAELKFVGLPQDPIVYAVRDGKTDAGMVRTDTLERLAAEGRIRMEEFRILNPQHAPGFPFALSTRLYPEWPFARARHTDDALAQRVAVALLDLTPPHPAARASKSAGWTVPLDYTPVHELYRDLRVGPYEHYGELTLAEAMRAYWRWIAAALAAFVALGAVAFYILRLNRVLNHSQAQLIRTTRDLERANRHLERLSTHDGLTGIVNHRHFLERLEHEWRRARRERKPLALLMADIDFFKALNDANGHLAGDEFLRRVAQALHKSLRRPGDLVARYGGEEFVAVLPGVDLEQGTQLAKRLRAAVEDMRLAHPAPGVSRHVTVSVGVASLVPERGQHADSLVAAADRALYRAKQGGRNRVERAAPAQGSS